MIDFLAELRAARRAPVAVFHEFRTTYPSDDCSLHAFVEGLGDKEYLTPGIKRHIGDFPVRFYLCDGKDGVLSALKDFEAEFSGSPRTLFFVDRDYWDILGRDHPVSEYLFVTDNYSIETDFATSETLNVILTELVHLDHDDPVTKVIVEKFAKNLDALSFSLKEFTAEVICEKRIGCKVNLNNIALGKIYDIGADLNLTVCDNASERLRRACGIPSGAVNATMIAEEVERLTAMSPSSWLRGKFQLWLFVRFVNEAWKQLARTPGATGRRFRMSIAITEKNVFQIVAGRSQYPASLVAFLSRGWI